MNDLEAAPAAAGSDAAPSTERMAAALAAGTAHLSCLTEADGTIVEASPSWQLVLGYEPGTLLGQNLVDLIHEDDRALCRAILDVFSADTHMGRLGAEGADLSWDVRISHADGGHRTVECLANNLLHDPDVGGFLFVGRNVTERRMLDSALTSLTGDASESTAIEQLLGFLDARIEDTQSALWISEPEPSWITGSAPEELLVDCPLWEQTVREGIITLIPDLLETRELPAELVCQATDAGYRSCWVFPIPSDVYASKVADREAASVKPTATLVVWSRHHLEPYVTNWFTLFLVNPYLHLALLRRTNDLQMRAEARTDALTGLLSRTGMRHELAAGHAGLVPYAVLVADLDDFKAINDHHGHEVGDVVLAATAARLREVVRDGDVVGRLGGDEFLICLAEAELDDALAVAERLVETLGSPVEVGGRAISVTASVGIAPADADASLREVVGRADQAMYEAKRTTKGTWRLAAVHGGST